MGLAVCRKFCSRHPSWKELWGGEDGIPHVKVANSPSLCHAACPFGSSKLFLVRSPRGLEIGAYGFLPSLPNSLGVYGTLVR